MSCTERYAYGSHPALALAQEACISDMNCRGVLDSTCNKSGSYSLCPLSAKVYDLMGTCVYDKIGD